MSTQVRDYTWINISDQQDRSLPDDIKVSLPLQVEHEDLKPRQRNGRTPTRSQNAFFVYRIAYAKELQARGYWDCPMRDIIKRASSAWKTESPRVKEACQLMAKEAKKMHEKFFPSQRRRCKQVGQQVSPIYSRPIGIIYNVGLPGMTGLESVLITNASPGRHDDLLYSPSMEPSLPITFIDSPGSQVFTQATTPYEFGYYDTPQHNHVCICD
ncbi:7613_t:CDS:1 [Paraglomus occultum]|uniref:7613_t:CDS:1 n=1 Tax=Paraglomus occultum TaxID=144539 RepID=A0A9N9ACB9_9GLOM|nr:7613_t:CDS:1 [Paraglomus occultum]